MSAKNEQSDVEEQKKIKLSSYDAWKSNFKKLLFEEKYETAESSCRRKENTVVCLLVTGHLNTLVTAEKFGQAWYVADLFGRNLETYLTHEKHLKRNDHKYIPK